MAISKFVATLSVLAVIGSAEAKKRPTVLYGDQYQNWDEEEPVVKKVHQKKVRSPTVESSGEALCLFKDQNNEWCFSGTTPMLESGWSVEQTAEDGAWTIKFKPYIDT